MQSKLGSFIEASANVLVGFWVAVLAQLAIFPWFGIYISVPDHILMGVFFTFISLARVYFLRRAFNWFHRG